MSKRCEIEDEDGNKVDLQAFAKTHRRGFQRDGSESVRPDEKETETETFVSETRPQHHIRHSPAAQIHRRTEF